MGSNAALTQAAREEAFLDAAVKAAGKCGKQSCGKSVKLMGSVCKFCHAKFCFEHAQAEAHGCGADAKMSARASRRKPSADERLPATKKEGIRAAHRKKMGEMAAARHKQVQPGGGRNDSKH